MNPLDNIRIVLVSPLYGGNVGATCRAMMNMGISRLVLVAPRSDLDLDELRMMAYHAFDIYDNRTERPTLAEAVADCGLVAGTTARMGLYRQHARTPRAWAPHILQSAQHASAAIVFGPEDKGLSNDHLSLCTRIVQIPSTESYTSLNLSQAVMLCAYELYEASGQFKPVEERHPEAPSELRERMFAMWEKALLDIGFMEEEKAMHMMLGLRRILSRGTLSEADVQIMMGIANQAIWVSGELRKRAE